MLKLKHIKSRIRAALACGLFVMSACVGIKLTKAGHTRVIVFHHLDNIQNFTTLVRSLKCHYSLISFTDYLQGRIAPDRINIILAFDDGYRSWTHLLKLIADEGIAPLLFVNSDFIDLQGDAAALYCKTTIRTWPEDALTCDSLKALAAAGAEIGGHTRGHINLLTTLPDAAASSIAADRTALANALGVPPRCFAYPFGLYNETAVQLVQASGYTYGFSSDAGDLEDSSSPYMLRRINIGMRPPLVARALIEGWGEVITTIMARLRRKPVSGYEAH